MNLEQIWKKEYRKRKANELRKDRMILNWPIHAQRAVEVFRAFSDEASKDGIHLNVTEPEWSPHPRAIGSFILGATSVHLRFGIEKTGEGVLVRKKDGSEEETHYFESGAELIVHFSPAGGLIQVYFKHPVTNLEEKRKEPILYRNTYNSDDLTYDWLASLIPPFLAFNRFESVLARPGTFDSLRMRWWLFFDIRNRRGYIEKFQHLFTTWELLIAGLALSIISVIAGTIGFSLLKAINWIWDKI
ncbi:hypothetical protein [Pseudomonas sp. Fl4BN1]|uniref:hypothetical protein n=1 Tax=Pseudomonas sp. Fl4BN1 TaxID=2697651 RepID=UPI001378861C|nr:hypothetical protein [Pseudomonas sp. Fl4BN1]NBF13015.1 hypothetical protein [Pseudomonas sp. Fl4BN1]